MGCNNVILNNIYTDLKQRAALVKQYPVLINELKEKEHNRNELQQKLTPIYIREKNLILRWQQHHCFSKKQDTHHIKIVFNLKARKKFVFVSWFRKQKLFWYHDFLGR